MSLQPHEEIELRTVALQRAVELHNNRLTEEGTSEVVKTAELLYAFLNPASATQATPRPVRRTTPL